MTKVLVFWFLVLSLLLPSPTTSLAAQQYTIVSEASELDVHPSDRREFTLSVLSCYPEHLQEKILTALGDVYFTTITPSWQAGNYAPSRRKGGGIIRLDAEYNSTGQTYTLVHEFAHALDYSYEKTGNGRKLSDQSKWVKIYNKDPDITLYAKQDRTEGFAEAIMLYLNYPEKLKQQSLEVYEYIDDVFNGIT